MADIMNDETVGKFKKSWFLNAKVPAEDDLQEHYDDDEERNYGRVYSDCYGNIIRTYTDSIEGFILLGCKDLDFAICKLELEKDGTLSCDTEDICVMKVFEDDNGWRCDDGWCNNDFISDEKGNITECFLEFAGTQKDGNYSSTGKYFHVPYTDLDSEAFRNGEVVLTKEAEEKWKKILLGEMPANHKTENQAKLWAGTPTDYFVTINEKRTLREVPLYTDSEGLYIQGDALESLKVMKERKFYIYSEVFQGFVKYFSQIKPSPEAWLQGKPQGWLLGRGSCDIISKRKKGEASSGNVDTLDALLQKKNLKIKKIEETKNIFKVLGIFNQNTFHSNILAWLLHYQDKDTGHGFQDTFLKLILKEFKIPFAEAEMGKNNPELWTSFAIYRDVPIEDEECKGVIDILCISEEQKFILCIKPCTDECSNQFSCYADFIEKHFCTEKGFEALFVYLTPVGDMPADSRWKALSYDFIHHIIKDYAIEANPRLAADDVYHVISSYHYILSEMTSQSYGICRFFRNAFNSDIKEKLKKDFPSMEMKARSWSNILFSDSSLKEFVRNEISGGTDLFFIAIRLESYEQAHGVLTCVLTFTNHAANAAEGSAFRKKFNPKNVPFNRFDAIRIEERLLNNGESFDDFQKDEKCHERLYAVVKTLLSKMKEEIAARGL